MREGRQLECEALEREVGERIRAFELFGNAVSDSNRAPVFERAWLRRDFTRLDNDQARTGRRKDVRVQLVGRHGNHRRPPCFVLDAPVGLRHAAGENHCDARPRMDVRGEAKIAGEGEIAHGERRRVALA